jgi:hypothetical protein
MTDVSGLQLLGLLPPLLLTAVAVWGHSTRFVLRRRGVRAQGRLAGGGWYAGLHSWTVAYTDQAGKAHLLSVPSDGAPGSGSRVDVVYDARNPGTAMSEFELRRPAWTTFSAFLYLVAVAYTVIILLWV